MPPTAIDRAMSAPANPMRPLLERIDTIIARAADSARAIFRDNPHTKGYLHYAPDSILLVEHGQPAPEGYALAHGEALRAHIPDDELETWIRLRVRGVPFLKPE